MTNMPNNVLQYSNELQEIVREIESNLLKVQNDKIKEFKNNVNNISNNCISDIQLLINQTHSKVSYNLSKNKIDEQVIDEFQFTVQSILLQAKNDLDTYKNQFDIEISDLSNAEILKLKKFISENHGKIESELHEALYQINQSENSALVRLEETYDLGVETIVSAEKTSLNNLKQLSKDLSIILEGKFTEIENSINEKLQNALETIKELEDTILGNISKIEINIKNIIQVEKEKIVAEITILVNNFKFTLQGYASEMKNEMTIHKNQLLEEIKVNKEELFIEFDKLKSGIIEALLVKENEIIQRLNNKTQELITEITAVVHGYDLELEKIKTAKIKEFTAAINLLKEQLSSEIINLTDDCKNQLNAFKEKHKSELFNETALHFIELRNECLAQLSKIESAVNKHIINLNVLHSNISRSLGTNENEGQWKTITDALKNTKNSLTTSFEQDAGNIGAEIIANSKKAVSDYLDHYMKDNEGDISKYNVTLTENQKEIIIPDNYLINSPNITLTLYIDGIKLIETKHYTVDLKSKKITFTQDYVINQPVEAEIMFYDLKGFKGIHGQYVFQIENDDLIVYVDEQVTSSSFSINENGELEIEII